ncbi:hypothetical protein DPMN_169797 [Dreissena polymorpha]|uniref:Uncharacterized protein n=1 Tax=Dreissena polymorpha TaxID=45954 RepID=A0A9D4DX71_DREPO|nr:hypothetical protein DPMN_169797 [Dreissena polymorpha]
MKLTFLAVFESKDTRRLCSVSKARALNSGGNHLEEPLAKGKRLGRRSGPQ